MENLQAACPICTTPFQTTKCITFPCGCSCCQSCLTQWIILKIREFHFSFDQQILCFNAKCQLRFDIQKVLLLIPQASQEQIDQALLDSYLLHTHDIRKCPNPNCSYAGIINISAKCSQSLKCEACQTTWRDPLHLTITERLIAFFTDNKNQRNQVFSTLWKSLWAKKCPDCQVPIQKYGGCPQMRCGYCGLCFCWTCCGTHNGFKHFFNVAIFYLFLITGGLFSFYGAYQLVLKCPPVVDFLKLIYPWGLKFLVWCLSFVITNIFMVYGAFLYAKIRKYPDRWGFCWEEVVLLSSFCCACTYYLELYYQLIIIALIEIPVVFVFDFLKDKGLILQKTD